jgi:hypothetical protein
MTKYEYILAVEDFFAEHCEYCEDKECKSAQEMLINKLVTDYQKECGQ